MIYLTITNHAEMRIKERCGLPKKAIEKNALNALQNGICHSETTGRFRKYIDWLFLSHKQGGKIRIYGNHVYIFNTTDKLITVLPLPNEHKNSAKKILKRKLKNDGG